MSFAARDSFDFVASSLIHPAPETPPGAQVSLELAAVPNSALWYPNGYGEAVLHNLSVTVGPSGAAGVSRWEKRIGLKSVELVQAPLPPGLPCGRPDCGDAPTCSDTPLGGPHPSCTEHRDEGKCTRVTRLLFGKQCDFCFGVSVSTTVPLPAHCQPPLRAQGRAPGVLSCVSERTATDPFLSTRVVGYDSDPLHLSRAGR